MNTCKLSITFGIITLLFFSLPTDGFGSFPGNDIYPKVHIIDELEISIEPWVLCYNDSTIVIGHTPVTSFQSVNDPMVNIGNIFVCIFDSQWNLKKGIIYGGDNHDFVSDVIIDPKGTICILGGTKSTNLPLTSNAIQTEHQNLGHPMFDGFFACFRGDSLELLYSTYFGGDNSDFFRTIDYANNMYILSGSTNSGNIPISEHAVQKEKVGSNNVFLSVFSESFTLTYSSYYGQGYFFPCDVSICMDNGSILLTGGTYTDTYPLISAIASISSSLNLPPPFQENPAGELDGFVLILDPLTYQIEYMAYIGKQDDDIIVSSNWITPTSILLYGRTPSKDFFSFDDTEKKQEEIEKNTCFFIIFDVSQSIILQASYLGGIEDDIPKTGFVLEDHSILLTGKTYSYNFPVTSNAIQRRLSSNHVNSFISYFDEKGHLVYSTLISYPEVEFLDRFTLSGNSLYMCATSIEKSTNKEKAWLCQIKTDEMKKNILLAQEGFELFKK